jgi:hypothetical protein
MRKQLGPIAQLLAIVAIVALKSPDQPTDAAFLSRGTTFANALFRKSVFSTLSPEILPEVSQPFSRRAVRPS